MVYLDYNSTTPTDDRVVQSMIPTLTEKFGNPSSENHDTGRIARDLVENARSQVANIVNMKPSDVIFTSGATEANNSVFYGLAVNRKSPLRIITSSIEHKSVLEPCRFLAEQGATVTKLPVTPDGVIDLKILDDILLESQKQDMSDIISVMAANSETGVIQPINKVVQKAHAHDVLVHCDATQAIGKIPFDAGDMDIDFITFSSHKIYGPKGCGALVATRHARKQLHSMLRGGGQENNMRSGTLNVPAIVGFGHACQIAADELLKDSNRQQILRYQLEDELMTSIPNVTINGKNAPRIPNTSSIRIAGALADAVIVNASGIEIATGSACSSSTMEPSHVLTAMGLSTDEANESIRISLGRHTTKTDIETAVNAIAKAVQYIRKKEMGIREV